MLSRQQWSASAGQVLRKLTEKGPMHGRGVREGLLAKIEINVSPFSPIRRNQQI
jgi:hypothetical protein